MSNRCSHIFRCFGPHQLRRARLAAGVATTPAPVPVDGYVIACTKCLKEVGRG